MTATAGHEVSYCAIDSGGATGYCRVDKGRNQSKHKSRQADCSPQAFAPTGLEFSECRTDVLDPRNNIDLPLILYYCIHAQNQRTLKSLRHLLMDRQRPSQGLQEETQHNLNGCHARKHRAYVLVEAQRECWASTAKAHCAELHRRHEVM